LHVSTRLLLMNGKTKEEAAVRMFNTQLDDDGGCYL
jgi:hypothetical protein